MPRIVACYEDMEKDAIGEHFCHMAFISGVGSMRQTISIIKLYIVLEYNKNN